MDKISRVIEASNSNRYSNGNNGSYNEPTIAIAIGAPEPIITLSVKEENSLIEFAKELIDSNYRLWFIKRLRVMGKKHFIESANSARKYDGISRKKVFAYLLKG